MQKNTHCALRINQFSVRSFLKQCVLMNLFSVILGISLCVQSGLTLSVNHWCSSTWNFTVCSYSLDILSKVTFEFMFCRWILMDCWSLCWELQDSALLHLSLHGLYPTVPGFTSLAQWSFPHTLFVGSGVGYGSRSLCPVLAVPVWVWQMTLPCWHSSSLLIQLQVHLSIEVLAYDVKTCNISMKSWMLWQLQRHQHTLAKVHGSLT